MLCGVIKELMNPIPNNRPTTSILLDINEVKNTINLSDDTLKSLLASFKMTQNKFARSESFNPSMSIFSVLTGPGTSSGMESGINLNSTFNSCLNNLGSEEFIKIRRKSNYNLLGKNGNENGHEDGNDNDSKGNEGESYEYLIGDCCQVDQSDPYSLFSENSDNNSVNNNGKDFYDGRAETPTGKHFFCRFFFITFFLNFFN